MTDLDTRTPQVTHVQAVQVDQQRPRADRTPELARPLVRHADPLFAYVQSLYRKEGGFRIIKQNGKIKILMVVTITANQ